MYGFIHVFKDVQSLATLHTDGPSRGFGGWPIAIITIVIITIVIITIAITIIVIVVVAPSLRHRQLSATGGDLFPLPCYFSAGALPQLRVPSRPFGLLPPSPRWILQGIPR